MMFPRCSSPSLRAVVRALELVRRVAVNLAGILLIEERARRLVHLNAPDVRVVGRFTGLVVPVERGDSAVIVDLPAGDERLNRRVERRRPVVDRVAAFDERRELLRE